MSRISNPSDVHVVIRVRPLSACARADGSTVRWKVKGNEIFESGGQEDGVRRSSKPYVFDRIFDSDSTTEQVFNEVGLPILTGVMDGYNGTIFAYGQTASGKTHTMMGNKKNEGVIPRMARALFECIQKMPTRDFLLRVTCLEIYNEKVYDLLSTSTTRKALNLREGINGQPFVEDLKWVFVNNFVDLMETMWQCEGNRSFGATAMNERSSRSHTIFSMIVESSLSQDGSSDGIEGAVRVSHLNLVDLAGSERAGQMGSTGSRFKEGCAINTSLFVLRNVINKLTQSDSQFINFRDSKLTRILQASLGGNARTSIICTVTPDQIEETHSTLMFASTAKTMENKPIVNEILSDEALLKKYARQLQDLLKEREALKEKEKNQEEIERELEESNRKNLELEAKILGLKKRIIHSSNSTTVSLNPKNRRETWAGHLKMCAGLDDSLPLPDIPHQQYAKWQDDVDGAFDGPVMKLRRIDSKECQTDDFMFPHSTSSTIAKMKLQISILVGERNRSQDLVTSLSRELKETQDFARMENSQYLGLETMLKEAQEKLESFEKTSQDAESLCLESNKKCSVLVDANNRLEVRVLELENILKNTTDQEACLENMTSMNQEYKKELMTSRKRIDHLESVQRDHDVLMELQNKRHEKLVGELRGQLEETYNKINALETIRVVENVNGEHKKIVQERLASEIESNKSEVEKLSLAVQAQIDQHREELELKERNETQRTDEVSTLLSQIVELNSKCSKYKAINEDLSTESERLTAELVKINGRNEELFIEVGNMRSKIIEMDKENVHLNTEYTELSTKITAMEEVQKETPIEVSPEVGRFKDEILQLEIECSALKFDVEKCGLKNIDLQTEINSLRSKIDEDFVENVKLGDDNEQMKCEIVMLTKEINELNSRNALAISNNEKLLHQIEKVTADNVKLTEKLENDGESLTNKSDADDDRDGFTSLVNTVNSMKKTMEDQRASSFEKLQVDYIENLEKIKNLNSVVNILRQQIQTSREDIEYGNNLAKKLKSIIEEQKTNTDTIEIQNAEYEVQIRFLEADTSRITSEFRQREDELIREKYELQKTVCDLQTKIDQSSNHELEMFIVQQEFERREAELKRELLGLSEKYEAEMRKMSSATNCNEQFCRNCTQLLKNNTSLTGTIVSLEEEVNSLKIERDQLKEDFEFADEDREKFKRHCDDYHDECEDLATTVADLRKELANLNAKKLDIKSSANNDSQHEKLQADNNRLQEELNKRITKSLQEAGRMDVEKRQLHIKMESLVGTNKVLEKQNLCLRNDIRRLQLVKMNTTNVQETETLSSYPKITWQDSSNETCTTGIGPYERYKPRLESPKKSPLKSSVSSMNCNSKNQILFTQTSLKENISPTKTKDRNIAKSESVWKPENTILNNSIFNEDNLLDEPTGSKDDCKVN